MKRRVSRRLFLKTAALGAMVSGARPARGASKPRVIILGFDGMEPSIVNVMMKNGELPNLHAVQQQGNYQLLRSTLPPQSPVAWASFATCQEPGYHGVFDFLRRNPRNYVPLPGIGITQHPEFAPDGSVVRPAQHRNFRQGEPFWKYADKQGVRSKLIHIPFSYPADMLAGGKMLCGEGVPDIRGYTTTFFALSDSFSPQELSENVSGGVRLPLRFENDVATVEIEGAADPRKGAGHYVSVPMEVRVDRGAHRVAVTVQGKTVSVNEKSWSDWLEWEFAVTPKFSVRAISRLYAQSVGDQVQLYMSSLQFDPRSPYIPISHPTGYAAELADRYGLYKTIGWAYDTHALRQDAFSEDAFLEDARWTEAWVEQLTLDELDRDELDLLISVWTSTDRLAHMFWRYRDPKHPMYSEEGARRYGGVLEDTYQRMDAIVGKVRQRLREDDLLIVLSDHGFHSFRIGFNVNTWLIRNGYLAVKGAPDSETAFTETEFLQGFDWTKSRAYSLGLGSIYLNLRNREGNGIVNEADAETLIEELRAKLLEVVYPETGENVFSHVYTRHDFGGKPTQDTPDLELGYADGYQSTKSAAKGAAPKDLFELNVDKWSGEHGGSDVAISPGILFATRALASDASIMDIGATALAFLGMPPPPNIQGKPLI